MLLAWFSVVLQDYLPYSLNAFEVSSFIKKNIGFYLVLAIFLPKRVGAWAVQNTAQIRAFGLGQRKKTSTEITNILLVCKLNLFLYVRWK